MPCASGLPVFSWPKRMRLLIILSQLAYLTGACGFDGMSEPIKTITLPAAKAYEAPAAPLAGPKTDTSGEPTPENLPNAPAANPATPVAAGPAPQPLCPGLGTWDPEALAFEGRVLVLVNAARAKGGTCGTKAYLSTGALKANAKLDCVARAFAKRMKDEDFFDHASPDGTGPFDRMEAAGLTLRRAGENIAVGQKSPEDVMEGWLDSPGHCANIFGDYKEIGIGYYQGYWVQDFMTSL